MRSIRLRPLFTPDRIFVVTNPQMAAVLMPQAPELPVENFILEPSAQSAPAAGLAAIYLATRS